FELVERIAAEQRDIGVGGERYGVLVPRPAQDLLPAIGLTHAPFAAQAQDLRLGRGQEPLDLFLDQDRRHETSAMAIRQSLAYRTGAVRCATSPKPPQARQYGPARPQARRRERGRGG